MMVCLKFGGGREGGGCCIHITAPIDFQPGKSNWFEAFCYLIEVYTTNTKDL